MNPTPPSRTSPEAILGGPQSHGGLPYSDGNHLYRGCFEFRAGHGREGRELTTERGQHDVGKRFRLVL